MARGRAAPVFGTIFVVQEGAALGSWLGGSPFERTGGDGAALAIAAVVQLVGAGVVSLTIDEAARRVPRLRPAAAEP